MRMRTFRASSGIDGGYLNGSRSRYAVAGKTIGEPHNPLRSLDPLFLQLSHLGWVTPRFKEVYCTNRRQALSNLLQELTLIQKLYEGSPLELESGKESVQIRAMELNTHLVKTANFGDYSNSEKINILYQLRHALEILRKQHFAEFQNASAKSQ